MVRANVFPTAVLVSPHSNKYIIFILHLNPECLQKTWYSTLQYYGNGTSYGLIKDAECPDYGLEKIHLPSHLGGWISATMVKKAWIRWVWLG